MYYNPEENRFQAQPEYYGSDSREATVYRGQQDEAYDQYDYAIDEEKLIAYREREENEIQAFMDSLQPSSPEADTHRSAVSPYEEVHIQVNEEDFVAMEEDHQKHIEDFFKNHLEELFPRPLSLENSVKERPVVQAKDPWTERQGYWGRGEDTEFKYAMQGSAPTPFRQEETSDSCSYTTQESLDAIRERREKEEAASRQAKQEEAQRRYEALAAAMMEELQSCSAKSASQTSESSLKQGEDSLLKTQETVKEAGTGEKEYIGCESKHSTEAFALSPSQSSVTYSRVQGEDTLSKDEYSERDTQDCNASPKDSMQDSRLEESRFYAPSSQLYPESPEESSLFTSSQDCSVVESGSVLPQGNAEFSQEDFSAERDGQGYESIAEADTGSSSTYWERATLQESAKDAEATLSREEYCKRATQEASADLEDSTQDTRLEESRFHAPSSQLYPDSPEESSLFSSFQEPTAVGSRSVLPQGNAAFSQEDFSVERDGQGYESIAEAETNTGTSSVYWEEATLQESAMDAEDTLSREEYCKRATQEQSANLKDSTQDSRLEGSRFYGSSSQLYPDSPEESSLFSSSQDCTGTGSRSVLPQGNAELSQEGFSAERYEQGYEPIAEAETNTDSSSTYWERGTLQESAKDAEATFSREGYCKRATQEENVDLKDSIQDSRLEESRFYAPSSQLYPESPEESSLFSSSQDCTGTGSRSVLPQGNAELSQEGFSAERDEQGHEPIAKSTDTGSSSVYWERATLQESAMEDESSLSREEYCKRATQEESVNLKDSIQDSRLEESRFHAPSSQLSPESPEGSPLFSSFQEQPIEECGLEEKRAVYRTLLIGGSENFDLALEDPWQSEQRDCEQDIHSLSLASPHEALASDLDDYLDDYDDAYRRCSSYSEAPAFSQTSPVDPETLCAGSEDLSSEILWEYEERQRSFSLSGAMSQSSQTSSLSDTENPPSATVEYTSRTGTDRLCQNGRTEEVIELASDSLSLRNDRCLPESKASYTESVRKEKIQCSIFSTPDLEMGRAGGSGESNKGVLFQEGGLFLDELKNRGEQEGFCHTLLSTHALLPMRREGRASLGTETWLHLFSKHSQQEEERTAWNRAFSEGTEIQTWISLEREAKASPFLRESTILSYQRRETLGRERKLSPWQAIRSPFLRGIGPPARTMLVALSCSFSS